MSIEDRDDWQPLVFGTYSTAEILEAVDWPLWQLTRIGMKGASLQDRYDTLLEFYKDHKDTPAEGRAAVCITNYVHALSRGGMIR